MKKRAVEISDNARQDLFEIYEWISNAGSPQNAISHVERLEDFCKSFDLASERGTARNAIRIVLRMVGFERSTTIAFMTEEECVVILRILYGARDWEKFIS